MAVTQLLFANNLLFSDCADFGVTLRQLSFPLIFVLDAVLSCLQRSSMIISITCKVKLDIIGLGINWIGVNRAMDIPQALPRLLSHLQEYGHGDRLKREAMIEFEQILNEAGLSRRSFLRIAKNLGVQGTTVTSLGNWISCKHLPEAKHVAFLLDALEVVLKEHKKLGLPFSLSDQLTASSVRHSQELDELQRNVRDIDFANQLLEDTLQWIFLSDFPPGASTLGGDFVPMTRQHGIRRLNLLRSIHNELLDETLFPQSLPHALIVAASSITVSHHLLQMGDHKQALETADEGVYILEDVLRRYPNLALEPMIGYRFRNWSTLAIVGMLYKSNIYKSIARQISPISERTKFINLATATLQATTDKVIHSPSEIAQNEAGSYRDTAELLIEFDHSNLELAATSAHQATSLHEAMKLPESPLLHYICQVTLAKTLTLQGKFDYAETALTEATQAADYARRYGKITPGPAHKIEWLRADALLRYERIHAQIQQPAIRKVAMVEWKERIIKAWEIAHGAKLLDQQQQIMNDILQVDHAYRQMVLPELNLSESKPIS